MLGRVGVWERWRAALRAAVALGAGWSGNLCGCWPVWSPGRVSGIRKHESYVVRQCRPAGVGPDRSTGKASGTQILTPVIRQCHPAVDTKPLVNYLVTLSRIAPRIRLAFRAYHVFVNGIFWPHHHVLIKARHKCLLSLAFSV